LALNRVSCWSLGTAANTISGSHRLQPGRYAQIVVMLNCAADHSKGVMDAESYFRQRQPMQVRPQPIILGMSDGSRGQLFRHKGGGMLYALSRRTFLMAGCCAIDSTFQRAAGRAKALSVPLCTTLDSDEYPKQALLARDPWTRDDGLEPGTSTITLGVSFLGGDETKWSAVSVCPGTI
jgi:hypothetical protein